MRTVEKALKLLDHFDVDAPELGLSELARAASLDKATALRMLTALTGYGLLEQHPDSRKYRLGRTVLRLARVREATFPILAIVQPVLDRLAALTGETAHASLGAGTHLATIGTAEPQRTTRVHVEIAEPLPFHATASGFAYLAYAPAPVVSTILKATRFPAHTARTVTTAEALRREIDTVRGRGFAVCESSFEADVIGTAAPIFDASGHAQGAIAVASMVSRFTDELRRTIAAAVTEAAVDVSRALGAEPHPDLLRTAGERA